MSGQIMLSVMFPADDKMINSCPWASACVILNDLLNFPGSLALLSVVWCTGMFFQRLESQYCVSPRKGIFLKLTGAFSVLFSGEGVEHQQWFLFCNLYRTYKQYICRNIYCFRICHSECFPRWDSSSFRFAQVNYSFTPLAKFSLP